jgi:hypothetical protein
MGDEKVAFFVGPAKRSKMGAANPKRQGVTEPWFTRRGGFGRNHRAVDLMHELALSPNSRSD